MWERARRLWDGAKRRHVMAGAVSVVVFVTALLLVHRVLGRFDAAAVMAAAAARPAPVLMAALVLASASYVVLVGFDWLGLHHGGRRLPAGWVALVSFASHAVSHNAGFAVLSGGSVRLRMYSAFGLSAGEVAGVIAFAGLSFALGAAALAAAAFLSQAGAVGGALHLPPAAVRAAGVVVAAVLAWHLGRSGRGRSEIAVGAWRFAVPPLRLGLAQMAVAAADLALVAGVLYVLLPDRGGVSYPAFVGLYVVATLVGTLSHVPGGFGVFDGTLLLLLPDVDRAELLGALLIFRGLYNLLPLLLAALIIAAFEVTRRGRGPAWLDGMVPAVGAAAVFAAGVVLMIVGAVAGVPDLPPGVAEAARLAAGGVAAVLLLVGCGLWRQEHAAWRVSLAALALGTAAALLRGPDWITAAVTAGVAVSLATAAPLFSRHDGGPGELSWGWLGAAAAVVLSAVWLTLHGGHQPALRAELLAGGVLSLAALRRAAG